MYKKIIRMDKETRHDSILNMEYSDIVNYFKELKGGSSLYKQNIYKEDLNFLNSLTDVHHDTNKIAKKIINPNMSGGNIDIPKLDGMDDQTFNDYLDERYFNNINNMPRGTFCKQQLNDSESSCLKRSEGLETSLAMLRNYSIEDLKQKNFWKVLIYDFLEFLVCCSTFYTNDKYAHLKLTAIIPISNIILATPLYTRTAMNYINILLDKEPKLHISEFHNSEKRRLDIKDMYGTNSSEYVQIKKCQNDLVKKYGFGLVLINKIIYKLRARYVSTF